MRRVESLLWVLEAELAQSPSAAIGSPMPEMTDFFDAVG